jgi:hypothetical protein
MSLSFARLLSILLHPVLMPGYVIWFLLHDSPYFAFTTTPVEQLALYIIVLVNTILLPVCIAQFMVSRGWIASLEMENRRERTVPFFINCLLLLFSCFLIQRLRLPGIYVTLLLGAAIAVAVALLINLKWKISIHMLGIGGFLGILFGISNLTMADFHLPIVVILILAGLLGTARLTLGAHTKAQLYTGIITGFLCEFITLMY